MTEFPNDPLARRLATLDVPVDFRFVTQRVSAFGDKATSAGYAAELVGGYADAGRTILFVRIDPPGRIFVPFGDIRLSDQFGHGYRMVGATANMASGENALLFQPIDGLATTVGARVHVAFTAIEEGLPPDSRTIAGRWELTATLAVDEGVDL